MSGIASQTPVGRIGSDAEMAALCVYLCSDRASFTTGETILCDGGLINTAI